MLRFLASTPLLWWQNHTFTDSESRNVWVDHDQRWPQTDWQRQLMWLLSQNTTLWNLLFAIPSQLPTSQYMIFCFVIRRNTPCNRITCHSKSRIEAGKHLLSVLSPARDQQHTADRHQPLAVPSRPVASMPLIM